MTDPGTNAVENLDSDIGISEADVAIKTPDSIHGSPVTWSGDQQVLHPSVNNYLQVVQALKDDGFNVAIDVAAVDYLTAVEPRVLPESVAAERFELVVNLLSHSQKRRIRLRVQVPEHNPVVPTLFDLYPGTEAMEREVFDLMGLIFENHPDLNRILMPEDWEGHPLRKDYDQGRIPVQFKYTQAQYPTDRDVTQTGTGKAGASS